MHDSKLEELQSENNTMLCDESKDNLERMLDVLYEFDYDGLSIDDLKTLRDTFYNEFQTLEKHIRYSDESHVQMKVRGVAE